MGRGSKAVWAGKRSKTGGVTVLYISKRRSLIEAEPKLSQALISVI